MPSDKLSPEPATPIPAVQAPDAARQVRFHQLLLGARARWLRDALDEALTSVDPNALKAEISRMVPADVQAMLAGAGIRDEHIFPTPVLIRAKPSLIAYYRLLLGVPRKTFYGGGTGRGLFASAEETGKLTKRQDDRLEALCAAMILALADLIRQIAPTVTPRDVSELPLLTLGSYFQGLNNNAIGAEATQAVFAAIREIVAQYIVSETETSFVVRNSSDRRVRITLASDPDVRIDEEFGTDFRPSVALEIKGGTDRSNAHNRAGEAEKSHQKARIGGYREFWTIIAKIGLDMETLKSESPTTRSWFDASEILGRQGDDWSEFRSRIAGAVGIPL